MSRSYILNWFWVSEVTYASRSRLVQGPSMNYEPPLTRVSLEVTYCHLFSVREKTLPGYVILPNSERMRFSH